MKFSISVRSNHLLGKGTETVQDFEPSEFYMK